MDITYRHQTSGRESTHAAPVYGFERSPLWERVDGPAYAKMRKAALVELCEQRDLPTLGTVPELVERLRAYDTNQAQADGRDNDGDAAADDTEQQ